MTSIVLRSSAPRPLSTSRRFFPFYAIVVVVQGIHVIEHIIQLLQVYVFGVADEDALGLLGYLVQFNGTEEYLHLGFNVAYLLSLYVIVIGVGELVATGRVPRWAFYAFLVGGAGLETWHVTEHVVIMYHVITNRGCPCPGIGDRALNVSDTVLHFFYNTIAYTATVIPFVYVWRRRADLPLSRLVSLNR